MSDLEFKLKLNLLQSYEMYNSIYGIKTYLNVLYVTLR